mgnify:CR=1 FL=1
MKRLHLTLLLLLLTAAAQAQTDTLRGHWLCKAEGIHLYIDLAEESISVPRYEFLGKMNGYLRGGMSETWFLVAFKQQGHNSWLMRFSNESGTDTQELMLYLTPTNTLRYKARGPKLLRRAVRGKWVYLPEEMTFEPA